jgi:excisionase family DNA binding protein
MQSIYTQKRSSHRRGFAGTAVRSSVRTRGAHDSRTLVRLITVQQASELLGLSSTSIEMGVCSGEIPHYDLLGELRFDPVEIERWLRWHHYEALSSQGHFTGRAGS